MDIVLVVDIMMIFFACVDVITGQYRWRDCIIINGNDLVMDGGDSSHSWRWNQNPNVRLDEAWRSCELLKLNLTGSLDAKFWLYRLLPLNGVIKFRFFIAMATQSLQADFTDVSVLPVIVQRLKEERVEVRHLFLLHLSSILNISLVTFVINKQFKNAKH